MSVQIQNLVRSRRRTIALIVEGDGTLTVRAPLRISLREIESFVREKTDWISRTQQKMRRLVQPARQYMDGETFLFLGSAFDLKLVEPQRPLLDFREGFHLSHTAQKKGEQVFTRWYKERASEIISDRVGRFARQYDFSPKLVRITSARTRWGSCSPDGTLNFTWQLVMAPLDVIDYVVVHELVHLQVKNHSKRFWEAVGSILPGYKLQRKWLKAHGEELTL